MTVLEVREGVGDEAGQDRRRVQDALHVFADGAAWVVPRPPQLAAAVPSV